MNSKLIEHLQERDIAPILAQSTETNDEVALKLMCIIDHTLLKRNFYAQLKTEPKLIHQVIGFKSFRSFNFWKYNKPQKFPSDYVLECSKCKLIGPYYLILSHMATTHNFHVGSNKCLYCKRVETKVHIEDNTFQHCYEGYLKKNGIESNSYPHVIINVYDMLQELARILGVLHTRTDVYTAKGRKKKENWFGVDEEGDINETVFVFENNSKTPIDLNKLDMLFKRVIEAFYGGERAREFLNNVQPLKRESNENGPGSVKKIKPNVKQSPNTPSKSSKTLEISTPKSSKASTSTETSNEEADFMNSIMTFLSNLDEKEKHRAKLEIQVVALNYSTKSMQKKCSENSD